MPLHKYCGHLAKPAWGLTCELLAEESVGAPFLRAWRSRMSSRDLSSSSMGECRKVPPTGRLGPLQTSCSAQVYSKSCHTMRAKYLIRHLHLPKAACLRHTLNRYLAPSGCCLLRTT